MQRDAEYAPGLRERPHIRAERLEEPIWSEVKRVIQNPDLIVAGIDTLDAQGGGGLEEEIAQAERDLRSIQMEEDRAIRLFVSGKITEAQLDLQRRFIAERLESARARLDDYRARESGGAAKRRLMETVLTWARELGQGLDELTPEQRKEILQMVVEQVVIDRNNNVDITLAIPIDDNYPEPNSPEPDSVAIASKEPSCSGLGWRYSRAAPNASAWLRTPPLIIRIRYTHQWSGECGSESGAGLVSPAPLSGQKGGNDLLRSRSSMARQGQSSPNGRADSLRRWTQPATRPLPCPSPSPTIQRSLPRRSWHRPSIVTRPKGATRPSPTTARWRAWTASGKFSSSTRTTV